MSEKKIGSMAVAGGLAAYFVVVLNLAFWRYVWQNLAVEDSATLAFAATIPLCLLLLTYAVMNLLLWPYFGKALISLLLVASALANYYMYNLNVYLDLAMVRNVFATNANEVSEMLSFGGALWIAVTGVAPAVVLCRLDIAYRSPLREAGKKALAVFASVAVVLAAGLLCYKDYSALARNNKMVEHLINPSNYLNSTFRYLKRLNRASREFAVIDDNPVLIDPADNTRRVVVLMVGETARAMNFSVNGYERKTNPKLERQDIASFRNVTASGTLTAFSVPCMFSHLPRKDFDVEQSYYQENLLDMLAKAGYDIVWLDNGVGDKGVAQRVRKVDLKPEDYPAYRSGDYLYDGVFVEELERIVASAQKHTVVVIHMIGSHGPSYHMRYPREFERFTPCSDTVEIQKLSQEEIVNTYDNTILYTDHVVSECIDVLKKHEELETALLFVSDHGESLGENGLYLHGFPYAFAPKEQTSVPMLMWMSEQLKTASGYDFERIKAAAADIEASHDNYFHTVLGVAGVASDVYDRKLDVLDAHRDAALSLR